MVKHAVAEEPVAGILSVDEAVDAFEVLHAPLARRPGLRPGRRDPLAGGLDAVGRRWVAREPVGQGTLPFQLRGPSEGREHIRHLAHVIASVAGVAEAELVGLPFRVAPIAQKQQLHAGAKGLAHRLDLGEQRASQAKAELRQLLPRDHGHGVTRRDVADFVAQDGCEFGLGIEEGHEPARDEDEPAGECEGVRGGVIHYGKGPGQFGTFRSTRQLQTHPAHVTLHGRVVHQANGVAHLDGRLLTHRDFLGFGDQGQLSLTGDRIGRATRDEYAGRQEGERAR